MVAHTGTIQRIQNDPYGHRAASIETPGFRFPTPGRYTLAINPSQPDAVLGHNLFPVGIPDPLENPEIPLLGPVPPSWHPGDSLILHPPSGRGFHPPPAVRRLALAAFGTTPARLLPLLTPALQSGADIVLFSQSPLLATDLPPDVEIQPLHNLSQALTWAAFLAIDIPIEDLPGLRSALHLTPYERIPCPAQALVWTDMPCSALAGCGVCAVLKRKGKHEFTCQKGPVFDLHSLQW
jgi:hypothetical protein